MPPTSVPADEVMKPGPSTDSRSRSERQKFRLRNSARGTGLAFNLRATCTSRRCDAGKFLREVLRHDRIDCVVDGDDAQHVACGVNDGNGEQIVTRDGCGDVA